VLWYIWKARNDFQFNNKKWKVFQVHTNANADMQASLSDLSMQIDFNPPQQQILQLPGETSQMHVTCYTNASYPAHKQATNANVTGIGIHMIHLQGLEFHTLNMQVQAQGISSPLEAETWAIYIALSIAVGLNQLQGLYFTDAQNLLDNLQHGRHLASTVEWRSRPVLAKARHMV